MATRKIIDAKHNGEKVWLKGHAQATYMSNGSTVEDAINSIQVGSGGTINTSNLATKDELAQKQDIISDLETIRNGSSKGATAVQPSSLATVATSGNYSDLTNKPTIPASVTESTVSGWGFTKNTGTYSKPSSGIPKSDLASAVQTSLSKADTALQSYTEQYKGTVTGVKINGTTKNPSSGVVDLGTVITSHQDISGKQDKLVSGTNIKTINGTSILGSGNIVISGGSSSGGSSSSGSCAYPEVDGTEYEDMFDPGAYICYDAQPNTFYVFPECVELIFNPDLYAPQDGLAHEYLFQFTSGSTPTTLSLPDDVKWANDSAPTISANKIYQISILKGLGSCLEFDNAAPLIENKLSITTSMDTIIVTSQYPVASDLNIEVVGIYDMLKTLVTLTKGNSESRKSGGDPDWEMGATITKILPQSDKIYLYTF